MGKRATRSTERAARSLVLPSERQASVQGERELGKVDEMSAHLVPANSLTR